MHVAPATGLRVSVGALLWAVVAGYSPASAAECQERWTRGRLDAQLERAESGFQSGDARTQRQTVQTLLDALPCLAEVPTPAQVLRLHRVVGMYHLVTRRDADRAKVAFAAARALDPAPLPERILDAEGRAVYESADPAEIQWVALPDEAETASWVVDGAPRAVRPLRHPALVQGLSEAGGVCASGYRWAPGDPPGCATRASAARTAQAAPPRGTGRRGAQLLSASGAGLLAIGASMTAGSLIRSLQYRDDDGEPLYTEDYYRGTLRPWSVTGGALTAVGVGALGGGLAWAALDGGQRPVLQLRGSW